MKIENLELIKKAIIPFSPLSIYKKYKLKIGDERWEGIVGQNMKVKEIQLESH